MMRLPNQNSGWNSFVAAFALFVVCWPILGGAIELAMAHQRSHFEQVLSWIFVALAGLAAVYLIREFSIQIRLWILHLRRPHRTKKEIN